LARREPSLVAENRLREKVVHAVSIGTCAIFGAGFDNWATRERLRQIAVS